MNEGSQKLQEKKNFVDLTQKKFILKNILSIRVRNFAAPNEPLNIKKIKKYFNSKIAQPYRLYGVKIMKIRAIEILTLGHL